MLEVLLWSLPRLLIAATPLALSILAAERAFAVASEGAGRGAGRSAPVWMMHAGFAAVSGASLLPWAMHLQPVNGTGLLLSVIAVALWPVLGALLGRPGEGRRRATEEPVVIFRHRAPAERAASGATPYSSPPVDADRDPSLPFLRPVAMPPAPSTAGRIALSAAEWHQKACAPSSRPMPAF